MFPTYRLITGNEMGIILLDYICRTRKALGTMPEHPVAVTTIVSTDMAIPVAEKYGVELRRTPTGFKFIGEQIGLLEAAAWYAKQGMTLLDAINATLGNAGRRCR